MKKNSICTPPPPVASSGRLLAGEEKGPLSSSLRGPLSYFFIIRPLVTGNIIWKSALILRSQLVLIVYLRGVL